MFSSNTSLLVINWATIEQSIILVGYRLSLSWVHLSSWVLHMPTGTEDSEYRINSMTHYSVFLDHFKLASSNIKIAKREAADERNSINPGIICSLLHFYSLL